MCVYVFMYVYEIKFYIILTNFQIFESMFQSFSLSWQIAPAQESYKTEDHLPAKTISS